MEIEKDRIEHAGGLAGGPSHVSIAVKSALALHLNTVVTAVLGFVYLIVAARLYDRDAFGRDMALVSAMMVIAAIAEVNLGMVLARFLPRLGERRGHVVARTYLGTSAVAIGLATAFVLLMPAISTKYEFLSRDGGPTLQLIFVIAVVCWNVFAINDVALTAVRRAAWVPIENGLFGVGKLVLMILLAGTSLTFGIFYSWMIPMVVLVVPMTIALFRVALRDRRRFTADASEQGEDGLLLSRRSLIRYIGLDYIASVFAQIGVSGLPILVVALLGTEANGGFAAAFSIITALEQFSLNMGTVLTVEGSFNDRSLGMLIRHSLMRFVSLLSLVVVAGLVLAPLAGVVFGEAYAGDVPTVLRLLLIGLLPQSIVMLFCSIARVQGKAGLVLAASAAQMIITFSFCLLFADNLGLNAFGYAWILGHGIVALFVAPTVLRIARSR